MGNRKGINITGFFGGLISSTAVTQTLAEKIRNIEDKSVQNSLVSATILANMTSFWRVLLIAGVMNWMLVEDLFPAVIMMSIVLVFPIIWLNRSTSDDVKTSHLGSEIKFDKVFSLGPAIKFALLFTIVTVMTTFAHISFGDSGFYVSSLISAMSGLDAITMNTASLAGEVISINIGVLTIISALIANLLIKIGFVSAFGSKYFRKRINMIFLLSSIVGLLVIYKDIFNLFF